MKHSGLFVCWLTASIVYEVSATICWDTGCQLDSWAVRGCQQYGMVETGQKSCPHGIIYSCCEQTTSSTSALKSKPKCWDTGCQLDSWAIRGCQQYGMIDTGQRACENGIIYSCCEHDHASGSTVPSRPKCWDTGCQLDSWAVRGCQQYGMIETGHKECPNGIIYSCCETNAISTGNGSSYIAGGSSTASSHEGKPKCWDTGCQLDSWGIRGCEQYRMVEVGQKWCDGGIVYSCCDKNALSSGNSNTFPQKKPKCWDTGCQLDSWAVRGCEQYGMVETGHKACQGGIIYSCCETTPINSSNSTSSHNINSTGHTTSSTSHAIDSSSHAIDSSSHTMDSLNHANNSHSYATDSSIHNIDNRNTQTDSNITVPFHIVKPKCWDTGCQLDSWLVRGCEPYNMVEVGQKWCDGGIVYSCCDKDAITGTVHITKPTCWDTGCQLDSWAVRGCEQYNMVETGQQPCNQGIVYSCCEKNGTMTDTSTPSHPLNVDIVTPTSQVSTVVKPKCWDTGCQLDSWVVRGCEQYNMIETGQRPCPNGIIYSCCHKNGTTNTVPSAVPAPVKPKCWDTGCQLDSWAVRGCEQYGMVEIGQKSCPEGIVYSCCERNGTSNISSILLKPKCWDTGCQLDSWAVRGCEQYDMLEVGQKSCPNGIVYSCCNKNVTTASPPPKLEPKCWDTGCQLDSWAVRGCEQYNMVQIDQKPCEDGIVYSCCQKNETAPVVRQAHKKCWDTGCQLDVWKSRGCAQYGMIEKSQKSCYNGIVFTCCRP